MDPTTIPPNIWYQCSLEAEGLIVELFARCNGDPETYRTNLNELHRKNRFRDTISAKFYALYGNANRALIDDDGNPFAYKNSDLVTGSADPGWRDFLETANGNRAMPPATARWVPDNERTACQLPGCKKVFGTFTRKHHCRLCGDIFCDDHSRQQMLVTNPLTANGRERGGVQRNERVCDACHRTFSQRLVSPLGPLGIQENAKGIEIEQQTAKVRPWQYITESDPNDVVARMQFVVSTGGGLVLFSRLNRSFQSYFLAHPNRKQAFYGYKVFSEEHGNGRSDSAVVYLLEKSDHRDVTDWWESAVSGNADFRSSLQANATAYGLRAMGHGGWAIDLPAETREVAVLGETCKGSAGGFIGNAIGVSFWRAVKVRENYRANRNRQCIPADPDLGGSPRRRVERYRSELLRQAESELRKLVTELYGPA